MAVFNAKPRILVDDVIRRGRVLTATGTDTDAQYDVDNIKNDRMFSFWKDSAAGVRYITIDMNLIPNPGLETGDYSLWQAANDGTVQNVIKRSGGWAEELIAAGSTVGGGETDRITVDPAKTYRAKGWARVSAYSAGNHIIVVNFYDNSDVIISNSNIVTNTGTTVGFVGYSKSIGPTGSGADIIFPAGSVAMSFQEQWLNTPTGTSYLDDVICYEETDPNTLGIAGHNLWSANAGIVVESSNDDTEVISSWTVRMATVNPTSDLRVLEEFTAVGTPQRAWRLKIGSAQVVPFIADLRIGTRTVMPRWIQGPFGPMPRKAMGEVSENKEGQYIQRVAIRKEVPVTMAFTNVTPSFVWDTLMPLFKDKLIKGIFYVSWDKDNYPDQAMVCYIADGFTLDPKFTGAVMSFSLTVVPIPEA